MNKIYEEIKKMHKYLYNESYDFYADIDVSPFIETELYFKNKHRFENIDFTYNIKTRKLSLYGYNISGHNGDHYNCEYVEITDKKTILSTEKKLHERYMNKCKDKAYEVALRNKGEKIKEILITQQLTLEDLDFIK